MSGPNEQPLSKAQKRRKCREANMTPVTWQAREQARSLKKWWWNGLVQDMSAHLHFCEREVLRLTNLDEGDARPQAAYSADLIKFESAMSQLNQYTSARQLVHPLVQVYRDRVMALNYLLPHGSTLMVPRWRADINEVMKSS